jgi:hypothetical protein
MSSPKMALSLKSFKSVEEIRGYVRHEAVRHDA